MIIELKEEVPILRNKGNDNNKKINELQEEIRNLKDEISGLKIAGTKTNLFSNIIQNKEDYEFLKNRLKIAGNNREIRYKLLYRASIDGDFEEVIKNNTEDKEKTLTLFYTYEGSRFGVFIHKKPSISIFKGKVYKEVPGTSFIFSLNNFKIFEISKDKTSKENIEDYLCFGRTYYLNKNGSNWLIYTPRSNFLKKKCSIGNQKGEYQFFDPEVLVGKKNEYHIKDVEIFHVVIE